MSFYNDDPYGEYHLADNNTFHFNLVRITGVGWDGIKERNLNPGNIAIKNTILYHLQAKARFRLAKHNIASHQSLTAKGEPR
jgi:hypothetical protein